MIPNIGPHVAYYKHDDPSHYTERPIVAWDDDGRPLTAPSDLGGNRDERTLIPADRFSNYVGIRLPQFPNVVSIAPSDGWRVEYSADDGGTWSEPLIGWGIRSDGSIVALTTDPDGYVDDLENVSSKFRIYHPDTA